jgi:predicted DNA-binding ribbon-helix-helix protein
MDSLVIKRSVVLSGHKTSVSLEDAFWDSFKEIAASRGMPLSALLTEVELGHHHGNLSSGIRLFVLNHYRGRSNISDVAGPIPLPSGLVPHQKPSLLPDAEY